LAASAMLATTGAISRCSPAPPPTGDGGQADQVESLVAAEAHLRTGGEDIAKFRDVPSPASTQVGSAATRDSTDRPVPITGLVAALANTREIAPVVASIALAAKVGTGSPPSSARCGSATRSTRWSRWRSVAAFSRDHPDARRLRRGHPLYLIGLFGSYVATGFAVVFSVRPVRRHVRLLFPPPADPKDVLFSLSKALILAVVVTLVHCFYGYTATGGPAGVGKAAGRALRTSIVLIMLVDVC